MKNDIAVTDHDIQALVDDELPYETAKQVLAHLNSDRKAQKRYQELLEQKKLLKLWWEDNQH